MTTQADATFREANRLARVAARLATRSATCYHLGLYDAAEKIGHDADEVTRHAEQALMRGFSIADSERLI